MDENILLIAFIAFVAVVLVVALILRRISVDDIFSDGKTPSIIDSPLSGKMTSTAPAIPKSLPSSTDIGAGRSSSQPNRQKINTIGKILGAVGAVMIFMPLPDALDALAWGIAILGYLLAKATTPPKEKASEGTQNPTAQKIRLLAAKPEYQEAMRILQADFQNPSLNADQKYRRAVSHLQSKGISEKEAFDNLRLLTALLNRQKKS